MTCNALHTRPKPTSSPLEHFICTLSHCCAMFPLHLSSSSPLFQDSTGYMGGTFPKKLQRFCPFFAIQLVTKVGTFNVIRLYWGPGKFPLKNLKGIWDWGFIKDHWSSLKTFRVFKEPLGFQRDLQSVKGPLGFLGTYRDSRRILGFLWWSYDGHDMMVRMVASVIRRDADWQASVTGADLRRPPYQSPSWWWWWRSASSSPSSWSWLSLLSPPYSYTKTVGGALKCPYLERILWSRGCWEIKKHKFWFWGCYSCF